MRRENFQYKLGGGDWATVHFPTWLKWFGHLRGVPNVKMAEIGTFQGRSAMWFAENILTGADSEILCIDTWEDAKIREDFLYNMRRFPYQSRIFALQGTSEEWLKRTNLRFDLIYIDGDHAHTSVLCDAENALDVIKPGGLILFDDYEYFPGVKSAVDEFLEGEPNLQILHCGKQCLLKSRPTEGNVRLPEESPPSAGGNGPENFPGESHDE